MGISDVEDNFMEPEHIQPETKYSQTWRQHFRHGNKFRKGQDTAIDAIAKRFDEGEKFVMAELPTGIGKSDVAMALAKAAPHRSYVTTSQNILIDQYMRFFGKDPAFYGIKGRANYQCRTGQRDCGKGAVAACINYKKHGKGFHCTYKVERDRAIEAQVALTNTTYFALACKSENWPSRSLAIVDECHNLASEIMSLTSMELSDYELQRMQISSVIPAFKTKEVPLDKFQKYIDDLYHELEFTVEELERDTMLMLQAGDQLEKLEALMQKIRWFRASIDEGVEWIVDMETDKRGKDKLIARPIDTAYFAQKLFFEVQANQYLLQSATIVDFKRYAEELGIDKAFTVKRPSPFDLTRRPIYDMGICSMNYQNIDQNLQQIADTINKILISRPNHKGLIHTGSYKIQQYLWQQFANNPRCRFPAGADRKHALDEHFTSKEPTVLFSPSMTEGVDGEGDSLRFQVICKIPYPSLADRRIKIKADRSYQWYQYQTAKTIIQMIGRGMRGEDDWCHNFILDAGFSKFAKQASLPAEFMNTVLSSTEGWKAIK